MKVSELAAYYRTIGQAYMDLADALKHPSEAPTASDTPGDNLPPLKPLQAVTGDTPQQVAVAATTALTGEAPAGVCPKHGEPWRDGRRGPYCPKYSDDPAWANQKGFCTIDPSNAAQYLKVRAAAR